MVKEMACPSDTNNGFVQIIDVITQSNLNSIIGNKDRRPFTMSLKPTNTIPSLIGNKIVVAEPTENTFTLQGNRFSLVDIQICEVLHKGYQLPGQTEQPVGELILTCRGNSLPDNPYAAMIISFPIYTSNTQNHGEYITQLLDKSLPSCKFEKQIGFEYSGKSYKTTKDLSISQCITSCCQDINCKAFNFKMGECLLKDNIPEINKTGDGTVAGKVDHTTFNPVLTSASCSAGSSTDENTTKVYTLESLFYSSKEDTSQTSFAYKTCFEIVNGDNNISSKNIAVFVFPRGIRLTPATVENLELMLNLKVPSYVIPEIIRDNQNTIISNQFGPLGQKTFTKENQSTKGSVYTTKLSSCSSEFKNRFEYFLLPPKLPSSSFPSSSTNDSSLTQNNALSLSQQSNSTYKLNQYKCVPFNKLTDISDNYVIDGNSKSLDAVLKEREELAQKQKEGYSWNQSKQSITTDQIETIVAITAGSVIGIIALAGMGSLISKMFNK
jgi:hypothetical protein